MEHRRCKWAEDPLLVRYHDEEFGKIVTDDSKLFEKLSLEIFQAGLSWRTVLVKRDALRKAFYDFTIGTAAGLSDDYLDSLLEDVSIIRNKKKIFAVRANARATERILKEGTSFFKFVYSFHDPEKLMTALKSFGFTFIGKTIVESFMQSVGILEAHEESCFLHRQSSGEV